MRIKREPKRFVAGFAALALVVAACGGDDDNDVADEPADEPAEEPADEPADEPEATDPPAAAECETITDFANVLDRFDEVDLSGITVNVGSKDFVEQFVLGELLVTAVDAAGGDVVNNVNLGGTVVNRDALESNEIDAYWEYNGTGWTVHLGQEDPSFDRDELSNGVCLGDLEANDIRWLGVSPFNNTYGFATAGDMEPTGLDLEGMAQYVLDNPDATVCMETEYPNRPDGLVLFEDAYDWTLPDAQAEILDIGVIYDETATGNCTFGEVFTTDGRIPALGLELIEDPGVHILYNVSLTMPDSVYQEAPEAFQAIAETILEPLDNDTMAELNRRVSADGEDPNAVAEDFARQQGWID